MGAGVHGGFRKPAGKKMKASQSKRVELPENDSQIKHIFGNREGHLPDTPENRNTLIELANNSSAFIGKDMYGNSWNVSVDSSGGQTWVRYQNGVINEGGRNVSPRPWNPDTGLNRRFGGRKRGKK